MHPTTVRQPQSQLTQESDMHRDQRLIAFDLFYAEHAMPAYRFALRLCGNADDAEDLVADALAKAFQRWSQYRGDANARTWLLAIVLNEWRMLCRRRPKQQARLESIEEIAATLTTENVELAEAIHSLPYSLKEAFWLVKGEGMTHAEAAKVARIPVGTMYFRVHTAVHKLRSMLQEPVSREEKSKREVR